MDQAISPSKGSTRPARVELPVPLDTLEIDGTAPNVGDSVELEVSGKITRIVGKTAYVRPDNISAEEPDEDDMDQLDAAYQQSVNQTPGPSSYAQAIGSQGNKGGLGL